MPYKLIVAHTADDFVEALNAAEEEGYEVVPATRDGFSTLVHSDIVHGDSDAEQGAQPTGGGTTPGDLPLTLDATAVGTAPVPTDPVPGASTLPVDALVSGTSTPAATEATEATAAAAAAAATVVDAPDAAKGAGK